MIRSHEHLEFCGLKNLRQIERKAAEIGVKTPRNREKVRETGRFGCRFIIFHSWLEKFDVRGGKEFISISVDGCWKRLEGRIVEDEFDFSLELPKSWLYIAIAEVVRKAVYVDRDRVCFLTWFAVC